MTKPMDNDKSQNSQASSSQHIDTSNSPPFPDSPSLKNQKMSLKDYYLSEYDDREEFSPLTSEQNIQFFKTQIGNNWKTFFKLLIAFIGTLIIISSLVYLWVSDQTEEEETKAAKSVADIAMSLTYAKLKNIQPQNQNWTHPEFLTNNLTPILAPNYTSMADIDAHGQFTNCPYMLRIHSSGDLSQFIVIAQPCPSLLQWLIPKASIVVDSKAMEMRKIVDLKALNRLIVNSNNLDEFSTNEISHLVSLGELIPLSSLVNKAENQGLAPPKALSLIRPGAENHIHNAPRYYLLGERILNHSLDLAGKLADDKEKTLLQQELNTLMYLKDLVLYTSTGIQHALKAQKALTTLIPNDKFLIAYLQLNHLGKIVNSHVLIDDYHTDIAHVEIKHPPSKDDPSPLIVNEDTIEQSPVEIKPEQLVVQVIQEVDKGHPLFSQLLAIPSARSSNLQPIADEIIEFVNKQTSSIQPEFTSRMLKLQQKYADADKEELNKIFKKFQKMTQDSFFLPASKFMEFIQASNLKPFFQEYLSSIKKKSKDTQITDEQIEQLFQNIQESATWQELEQYSAQMNQLLQFDRVPDETRLIALQSSARSNITQKLNQFILSSNEGLPSSSFTPDHMQHLTNILKSAWITDPEMHDFYISEFELRTPDRL